MNKQLEFEFIERENRIKNRNDLELLIGSCASLLVGAGFLFGGTYLKLTQPEILQQIQTYSERVPGYF